MPPTRKFMQRDLPSLLYINPKLKSVVNRLEESHNPQLVIKYCA